MQSSCAFVIYYIGPDYLAGIKNNDDVYLIRGDRMDHLPKKDTYSISLEYSQ
jgi:hypothetical protein